MATATAMDTASVTAIATGTALATAMAKAKAEAKMKTKPKAKAKSKARQQQWQQHHLPLTIKLDPSMTKSLIRGNEGEQGGKRQGQLLVKTWEVVTTVPSPRMRAAQRGGKTTKKATKPRSKLRIVL